VRQLDNFLRKCLQSVERRFTSEIYVALSRAAVSCSSATPSDDARAVAHSGRQGGPVFGTPRQRRAASLMDASTTAGSAASGAAPPRHQTNVKKSANRLCVPKTSNPTIMVMKSTKEGARTNDTGALYRARDGRILVQRPTRSDSVVVTGVRFQDATQMRLAQDNHVIDALAPDRADQPFRNAILPG
jgi:hypothetical protein